MKRIYHRLILLLGIFFTLTISGAAQEPSLAPRFGIVDSFVNTAEANAAGAGWSRIFLRWDVIQPAGPSDWKPANVPDDLLNAEVAAGREVVAVLIGTPAWATESHFSTAVPPLEFWGDFVYKVANQYKGRINHWVIWNQPNITDPTAPGYTWDGNAEDYYRLLKEGYLKIKAVDPTMQVHLAGLTYGDNPQYLADLLDIIAADPQAANENYFFDAVTYHFYYNPDQIYTGLAEIRATLNEHNQGHKPIWINETNAPPSDDFLEPATAPAALNITLEEQQAFVIQAFAMALAGGADRIAFYKLRNEPNPTVLYGLLRSDNSHRPAFDAFRVITKHFAGTQRAAWQQAGQVDVVTLERGTQTTTVLWNRGRSPTVFLLPAIGGQALLVDSQGQEQTVSPAGGNYRIELPPAICSGGAPCLIDGPPRLVIETGSPGHRTLEPPPPALPTPVAISPVLPTETATLSPLPPTLTPIPTRPPATPLVAAPTEPAQQTQIAPPTPTNRVQPTVTPIPPVTIFTILTPTRILWLFIIGLVVFTVTYGIQVFIWYRLRR